LATTADTPPAEAEGTIDADTVAQLVARLRSICEDEHVLTHRHDLRTYQSDGLLHYHVVPPSWCCPSSPGEVRDVIRVCHQLQDGRAVGRDKIDGGLIASAARFAAATPTRWIGAQTPAYARFFIAPAKANKGIAGRT
jgi:hypothetical protein